jgi:hypothetical protein
METMTRIRLLVSFALIPICTPAMAANYPWEGRWVPIGESCGEITDMLTYTKINTEMGEEVCNVKSTKSYKFKHSWYLDLECAGEGYEWKKAEILIFHENKLISYQETTSDDAEDDSSNPGSLQTFQRCN